MVWRIFEVSTLPLTSCEVVLGIDDEEDGEVLALDCFGPRFASIRVGGASLEKRAEGWTKMPHVQQVSNALSAVSSRTPTVLTGPPPFTVSASGWVTLNRRTEDERRCTEELKKKWELESQLQEHAERETSEVLEKKEVDAEEGSGS